VSEGVELRTDYGSQYTGADCVVERFIRTP
jgi:hypothetical protein